MGTIVKRFNGWDLTTFQYDGRPAWIAKEIGEALGYGNEGRKLITLIRNQWFSEFIEHHDYKMVAGKNLRDLRSLLGVDTRGVSTKTRNLLILFEPGVNTVCLKTNKPEGRKLRRWLADKVLPELFRKGEYPEHHPRVAPTAPPAVANPDPRLEVLRAREERLAARETRMTGEKKAAAILSMINRLKRLGQISPQDYALEVVRAGEVESGITFGNLRGGINEAKVADPEPTPTPSPSLSSVIQETDENGRPWKTRVEIAAEIGATVGLVVVSTRRLRIDRPQPGIRDDCGCYSPEAVEIIRQWLCARFPTIMKKSVPLMH